MSLSHCLQDAFGQSASSGRSPNPSSPIIIVVLWEETKCNDNSMFLLGSTVIDFDRLFYLLGKLLGRCCRNKRSAWWGVSQGGWKVPSGCRPFFDCALCVFVPTRTSVNHCGATEQDTGVRPSSCLLLRAPSADQTWWVSACLFTLNLLNHR